MIEPLKFTIQTTKGENSYTINLPTVGEFYDIEVNKQVYGKGLYNAIVKTNTIDSMHAADMIDIEAHLSVLCKDIMKDLKVQSFQELGLIDYNAIRSQYIKVFLPWWNKIQKMLQLDENEK